MNEKKREAGKMLSHEKIYRIMQYLPLLVSGVFFLKNVKERNTAAMLTIGICLAVFVSVLVVIKLRKVSLYAREYILAVALPLLVFVISLNSGASYSDDFSLFLAVIGMTGMYLEPKFTKMQIFLVDALLVLMYVIHPEKAESLSQYILCTAVATLAASLFYMVIRRGRAFIEISEERAKESEQLLESIRAMGVELQRDFSVSSAKIEAGTQGLQQGSISITKGAGEVSDSCGLVQEKIKEAEAQLEVLNEEVRTFEEALAENKENMEAMQEQVNSVSSIISESGNVFRTMEGQMKKIAGIAKQISDISFKLTILSLNASVEAARAGEAGSGFEVLATEMRELSENSGDFSGQVSEAVKELSASVERTSERFSGSEQALMQSEKTMTELVLSFVRLSQQFDSLYDNIGHQNENVSQIERIFQGLHQRVSDMHGSSLDNQNAVEAIVDAMTTYKEDVGKIVENTQAI